MGVNRNADQPPCLPGGGPRVRISLPPAASQANSGVASGVRFEARRPKGPITGITLIAGFASTVGWPFSAFLNAQFGWRAACLIWAALHTVMGLPLNRLLIPRAPPPVRASEMEGKAPPAPRGAMD